jgi:hypothetical protein
MFVNALAAAMDGTQITNEAEISKTKTVMQ